MDQDGTFLTTGLISLVLTAAFLGLGIVSYVKKHPQWRIVLPVYGVMSVLNGGFALGFLTHEGPQATTTPFLWWLLVTTISASSLFRTAKPVLQNRDFKDAGVL